MVEHSGKRTFCVIVDEGFLEYIFLEICGKYANAQAVVAMPSFFCVRWVQG